MKSRIPVLKVLGFLVFLSSCKEDKTVAKVIISEDSSMFNEEIRSYYFKTLDSAAYYMTKLDTANSLEANKAHFLESRKWYKRVEPLLMAYDYQNYLSMNAPNLLKVEIDDYTDIKKLQPKSYQVLEEMLYGEDAISNEKLQNVILYLQTRIPYIRRNHIIYDQRDRHHLKMIRDAIVNVATKGITGFDSPMLANSLQEAVYNYESIEKVVDLYRTAFKNDALYEKWKAEIKATIQKLRTGEFDSFDRYNFIKEHTNEQFVLIKETAEDWGVELSRSRPLNPKAENLFSKDFFNLSMFAMQGSPLITGERAALGKMLFNDENLSGSGTISCATCHIKEKAFTDGRKKALGRNRRELQRNTPTLPYAVYQTTFFYDGRGDGLEGQIVSVANNENEFHLDLNAMGERVRQNPKYKDPFDSLYGGDINNLNVRNAIATYIRRLAPFDSKFDRNIQGLEETLSDEERLGFNLFMGKAACATCHFPPAFNGLVPPRYMETEFENLGVPENASFTDPVLDEDPGLYYPYEVEEKRHFFKTSTVRNIEMTDPYMHNGVYATLDEVMEFYDVGGGQGMGLEVPYQTLPPDSLGLEEGEKRAIIAFMKTLTDKDYKTSEELLAKR